jgi:hypothetical protein
MWNPLLSDEILNGELVSIGRSPEGDMNPPYTSVSATKA